MVHYKWLTLSIYESKLEQPLIIRHKTIKRIIQIKLRISLNYIFLANLVLIYGKSLCGVHPLAILYVKACFNALIDSKKKKSNYNLNENTVFGFLYIFTSTSILNTHDKSTAIKMNMKQPTIYQN